MVATIRIRKTAHRYWWVEELYRGNWLIVDSFASRKAAEQVALEESAGRPCWARIQGHHGRISWVFKADWRLHIWHKQVMRDRPFVLLDQAQRELGRWPTLNQARIALLLYRAELPW